jgi:GDP-D-mannose dehydratase
MGRALLPGLGAERIGKCGHSEQGRLAGEWESKYIDGNVEHELSRGVFREPGDLLGSPGQWRAGHGILDGSDGNVVVNPSLHRRAEVHVLLGDAPTARREFCWTSKIPFWELVCEMLTARLEVQSAPRTTAVAR